MFILKKMLIVALVTVFSVASFAIELPANKIVDVDWLQKNIDNPKVVLVMADYNDAYKKGHIPGSYVIGGTDLRSTTESGLPIDLPTPKQFTILARKSGIDQDSIVVFYSSGESFKSEAKALELMVVAEHYGLDTALVLDGGLAAWKKAGGEVSTDKPKRKKANFEAKEREGVIATLDDVDKHLAHKSATFIDARPTKYYQGKDDDKRLAKHGAIPGAISIQAESLYETKDGVTYFKSPDAIKALFNGVDLSKPIISYCNTGHLTSGVWFAAKYIAGGKDVRNFKGSMVVYTGSGREVVKGQ